MTVRARWLGQAGFVVQDDVVGGTSILIDPYLSDSLAEKYAGTHFSHRRMRPAPCIVGELPPVTHVLCTHRHTDHMDPDTLGPLLRVQPSCRLIAPRAVRSEAEHRGGVGADRLDLLGADECLKAPGLTVRAVPAAHEIREIDANGDDAFLGYVVDIGGLRLYHSGDCAPYDGDHRRLVDLEIDVALMPVNGRDIERLQNGVPGNFSFAEAVDLCHAAGISTLVPHHWGMFAFNTVDPRTFDLTLAERLGVTVHVPAHGEWLDLGEVAA